MPTGRRWFRALVSLGCLGLLAGCTGLGKKQPQPPAQHAPGGPEVPGGKGPQPSGEAGNWFAADAIEVGSRVAGLQVTRVDYTKPDGGLGPLSATVAFSGQVAVTGTYIHYPPEEEFVGGEVCFDQVDEASAARLPRLWGDERTLWFCFRNGEEARRALNPAGVGEATVVIDEYTIDYRPTETWNTAGLVRVEAVRNARPWTKPVRVFPEGMEETRTFRLVYLPGLPFTTYVPADWQYEPTQSGETTGVHLVAPNDIGFVDIVFFPPGADRRRAEAAVAERLAAYPQSQPLDAGPDLAAFQASDRTAGEPARWKSAQLRLSRRGDRYYYVLTHLNRLEAGDGWAPVIQAIREEWRWRDTGEPLKPSP